MLCKILIKIDEIYEKNKLNYDNNDERKAY